MTHPTSTEVLDGPPPSPVLPVVPPTSPATGRFVPTPRQRWERPALLALLVITGALYLWDLSASGWANSFYSAAVQAGSESWKAFLFGASDAAASITVDKPPASLWVMGLSVRLFGLSSWAILVPQALMGVATVGVVYASVRRYFSAQAGLIAGAVLALTPVAALMFRFNNPDALLVLLLTLAVYVTLRAIEDGRTRWLVLAGVLVGLGFLTKQLQTVLVLPGIAAVYLIAAPVSIGRRIRDGLLAVGAMIVSAGWWVAIVELTPAADRPYIGGSTDNSFLNLTLGYNGLARILGRGESLSTAVTGTTGTAGGGAPTGGGLFSSNVGLLRMFTGDLGGHVAWLIPAALLLGLAGLWVVGRGPRTDVRRASLLLWGATLVVTGLTFSLMDGTFHQYYTVALAPAIGALVGIGGWLVWTRRAEAWALPVLAGVSLVTTGWAFVVLGRSPEWNPWLRWVVLAIGLVAAAGLVLGRRYGARVLTASAALALVAALAGPTSWTVQTVVTPHTGGAVTTGPSVVGDAAALGGGRGGVATGPGVAGGAQDGAAGASDDAAGGTLPGGALPGDTLPGDTLPGGALPGNTLPGGALPGDTLPGGDLPDADLAAGDLRGADGGRPGSTGTQGAVGAQPGQSSAEASEAVLALLLQDADSFTWVAATTGAENAASYQLPTERSVMPIGGFNGGDPSPTLEQFQAYVADGEIHYYIASGSEGPGAGGRGGDEGGSSSIATWVSENFTAETVDGVTLYDLTAPIG